MAEAVKGMHVGKTAPRIEVKPGDRSYAQPQPQYYVEPSRWSKFARNVGKKFLTTVELDIPRGLDMTSVLEGAQFCLERKIDAVNITEGARARLRMSSVAIS